MREILFRGKRVDNCEWAYGYYTVGRVTDDHVIEGKECNHVVIPETVGQYTGLNDKNGNRIFEGDILQHGYKRLVVWWNEEAFQWQAKEKRDGYTFTFDGKNLDVTWDNIDLGWIACETVFAGKMTTQVIGNIHDNPELLKEGK